MWKSVNFGINFHRNAKSISLVLVLLICLQICITQSYGTPVQRRRPVENKNTKDNDNMLRPLLEIEARLGHALQELKKYAEHISVMHIDHPKPESSELELRQKDFSYPEIADRSWSYPEVNSESENGFKDFD